MYYARCHSIVCYSIVAWGGAFNNVLQPLQKLLDRIGKLLPGVDKPLLNINLIFKINSLMLNYNDVKF